MLNMKRNLARPTPTRLLVLLKSWRKLPAHIISATAHMESDWNKLSSCGLWTKKLKNFAGCRLNWWRWTKRLVWNIKWDPRTYSGGGHLGITLMTPAVYNVFSSDLSCQSLIKSCLLFTTIFLWFSTVWAIYQDESSPWFQGRQHRRRKNWFLLEEPEEKACSRKSSVLLPLELVGLSEMDIFRYALDIC